MTSSASTPSGLFTDDYFLRHRPGEIAWHTEWLADSDTESETASSTYAGRKTATASRRAVHAAQQHTFAHATAVLDELGMTIVDARIVPLANDYSLDTFVFMETRSRIEIDEARMNKIRRSLTRPDRPTTIASSRHARGAAPGTDVHDQDQVDDFQHGRSRTGRTVMELVAADRPGLLSKVGQVFVEQGIDIETAKIMTIGERAEDVFYISDEARVAARRNRCNDSRPALARRAAHRTTRRKG